MLEISSDKNIITLKILCGYPIGNIWYSPSFTTSDEAYAKLLTHNMRENMHASIADIRRAAYESGWKDAKAKNKKKEWFSRMWKVA